MKKSELTKIIREEIQLFEKSRTGLPGVAEKEINIALRNLYKEDNINYGGCGIMAELLYYSYKKHFGVTPKIVCILATFKQTESKAKRIDLNDISDLNELTMVHNINLIHAFIQIPGTTTCLDADGFHSLKWFENTYAEKCIKPEFKSISAVVSNNTANIKSVNRWVKDAPSWNSTFSRARIPNLAKEVEALMAKAKSMSAVPNI